MKTASTKIFGLLALCILAGCSGRVGDFVNLSRSVPDEFAVVKREPLVVPPDFALRPPEESDRSSLVALTDTQALAEKILFGGNAEPQNMEPLDKSDIALLAHIDAAEPNIRRIIDQESTDLIKADRNFIRDLFSGILPQELPGKVVDPVDAERRVKQTLLVKEQPESNNDAVTIQRGKDTTFDWGSLWPF